MFAATHTQEHRGVLVGTLVVDGYTWVCGMHVCTGAVRSSVAGTKEPAPGSLSLPFTNDDRILLRPALQRNVIGATLVGAIMNECSNKTKGTPEILQVLAVLPLGYDSVCLQWRPREKGALVLFSFTPGLPSSVQLAHSGRHHTLGHAETD